MKILLVHPQRMPVFAYGGTERVVWDLARALLDAGHRVALLAAPGTRCPFASVIEVDPHRDLVDQIPSGFDVAHFHVRASREPDVPYVTTEHGNTELGEPRNLNCVFLSAKHASLFGSTEYVHNGLDWRAYGIPQLDAARTHFHFLALATRRFKNLSGAIDVCRRAGVRMEVMGGRRFSWKGGPRLTLSRSVSFHGLVGGQTKFDVMQRSRGLVFPVRWHEPFGLALIESLYFGSPVFATPYGAIAEIVDESTGFLGTNAAEMAEALQRLRFDPRACHDRAVQHFSAQRMAAGYLRMYERVCSGERLHIKPPVMPFNGKRLLPWT